MVWKHVLFQKSVIYPLKFEALRVLGSFSPSILCLNDNAQKPYSTKILGFNHGEGFKKVGFCLMPHVVNNTLVNCSSDLVALSFFIWCARQPNYFHDRPAFGHMVNVANRLVREFKSIKGIVRQLESIGCVTKAQTFLLLLRIFWQGELYGLVFDVFEEFNRFGHTANTFVYNVIIDVSFKIGRKDLALDFLTDIRSPNFLTYNIVVCHLCKLNDLRNMLGVLRVMLRSGYYPNTGDFVKIMNCFCKNGSLAQVFEVLGLIICLGIQVPVVVWNILIDGFCRIGRPIAAASILDKMVIVGCSPNVVTYTSLLKTCMEHEMVDDTLNILSMMENSGCKPDLILSNMLIHCFSKMGRYNEAMGIFFELRKHNMEPDSYTFSSIISAVRMSGKFLLLPKLVGVVIPTDLVVCNSLLSYLCKAGFPTYAVEFYHEMVDQGYTPDKYSYTGLLGGLCRARKIDEAVNVYQQMILNQFHLDAHVHTVVLDGLIKVGKYCQAVRLFKQVVAENCTPDVVLYTVVIEGLVRGGRVGEAWALYNKMKKLGVSPNARTYNLILSGLCKERVVNLIEQILEEMYDKGIELDDIASARISSFACKSRCYFSVVDLLMKMWVSGLIADSVMRALLLKGHSRGFIVGDICLLLSRFVRKNSFIDTSNSKRYLFIKTSCFEDLPDVVASVS